MSESTVTSRAGRNTLSLNSCQGHGSIDKRVTGVEWARQDSNLRPSPCQGDVLTRLRRRFNGVLDDEPRGAWPNADSVSSFSHSRIGASYREQQYSLYQFHGYHAVS